MQVPEFWGGIEPPVPRCRNCNALAKKTYGPIVPMDKPNPHDQTYLDAFGQANGQAQRHRTTELLDFRKRLVPGSAGATGYVFKCS